LRSRTRDRQNHAHLEHSALTGPGAFFMRHTPRLAAVAVAAWPVLAFTQAAPVPLTAETMWQLKRTGPPALSPDGKFAVYGVTRAMPTSTAWQRRAGSRNASPA
jgi:hypothetical protein